MKNHITMFLAGIFSGLIIIGLFMAVVLPRMLFTVSESKYDFDKTVEMITEQAQASKWNMPHQYDLQQTMAKHNFEVQPVKVFSLCKPDIAIRILGSDPDRHLSVMMPCRISVYQKADGKTYISRMNAGLFARLIGGKASGAMQDAGEGIEVLLKSLVKN
ncbi:MAG: DUF302 domain-containing protein [Prolixibacteraceae bacterium]|nr:DUF302 domain-containing protein [Prolixibacteraceae bacterium]